MEWPLHSLDLNIIEHLWYVLGQQVITVTLRRRV